MARRSRDGRGGGVQICDAGHLISCLRRQLPLIGEAIGVRSSQASPSRGGGSAKPRRRGRGKFDATSQSASLTAPLKGEPWIFAPRKKVTSIRISSAASIDSSRSKATSCKSDTPVSGGAYQDAREVSIVWNTRRKHRFLPKFRGRMHPASPRTLFSPIFSLAREKIGPPEARQKRPRRNEPPQATSLILCARFFLSKPQTEFAVWVFLCKSAATSQSAFG